MDKNDPCPCRSGDLFGDCHHVMIQERYIVNPPSPLRYRYPHHAATLNLANLAAQISQLSPYAVTLQAQPPRLLFELRHPLKWLSSWPVLRTPDKIGIWYDDPPLADLGPWPPLKLSDASERLQAFNRLGGRRDVTLDWLKQFQDDLTSLIVRNDAVSFSTALRQAIPLLRRHFPLASIDCFVKLAEPLSGTRLPITLAQLELLPIDEIIRRAESQDKVGGHHYLMLDPEPYFAILNNLSYPHVSGFMFSHTQFLLHFDYGELPYLPSAAAEERKARNVHSVLLADPAHRLDQPEIRTASQARIGLRNWLCRALDRFFSQLAHPGTFSSPQGNIHPRQQAEDLATVGAIVEITNLLLTEADPAIIRLLFFDLVDRYCALGTRRPSDLLSLGFMTKIVDTLDPLLGRARTPVRELVENSWSNLATLVWEGLYDPSARQANTITIVPPGGTPSTPMDRDEFASTMLNVLRDTTHGHGLDTDSKRHLLVRHSGLLPSNVKGVALSLWFGLISNPQLFWSNRAQFDSVRLEHSDQP